MDVKVELHPSYPDTPPVVYDVGKRFPSSPDYHNEHDGKLCLTLPQRKSLDLSGDDALVKLLDQVVLFAHRAFIREQTGAWPGPEEPHGQEAVLRLLHEETMGVDDPAARQRLDEVVRGEDPSRNSRCPCGSGSKYKACHLLYVQAARRAVRASAALDESPKRASRPQHR